MDKINYDTHDYQSASYSLRPSVTAIQIKSHNFCDDPLGLILSCNKFFRKINIIKTFQRI